MDTQSTPRSNPIVPPTSQVSVMPVDPVGVEGQKAKQNLICPKCHQPVDTVDYFCRNCGNNLKPAPPPANIGAQLGLYVKSALLPPMGLIWGFKYLTQKDLKSRMVGIVAMVITVMVLVIAVKLTIDLMNSVNEQVNNQMNGLGGF